MISVHLQFAKTLISEAENSKNDCSEVIRKIETAIQQRSNKEIDEIAFFLILKRLHYHLFQMETPDAWQVSTFLKQDLSGTFASSYEINQLATKIMELEATPISDPAKEQKDLMGYVTHICLEHWRHYAETIHLNNQKSLVITRLMGSLLVLFFALFSFQAFLTFFITLFDGQIVDALSGFFNTLITNKLIIVILFGMLGAATSIAMKVGNMDPVKPFEKSMFISIIWRKIFIGSWSSILANYFFSYTAPGMNPILLMLTWFSAGFSERFIIDVVSSTIKKDEEKGTPAVSLENQQKSLSSTI